MKKVGLTAIGSFVPKKKLTNSDLAKMVDTTDEWITSRTGIKERRIAPDDMPSSEMAVRAAQKCLAKTGARPDLLISSTATAEYGSPYQASIVANRLQLTNLGAFDLNAACSGLVYSLAIGRSLMQTGAYRHTLVTASEKMSMLTDYTDRASCVLFGDGAAAVMLSSENPEHEILTTELGLDATGSDYVIMRGPGKDFYFRQDGRRVFKFAVTIMNKLIDNLTRSCGIHKNDDFYIIPHQANYRMMEAVARDRQIPIERFVSNIDRYGNTSSASIGLALSEAWEEQRFKKGDIVLLIGFGGGLSWAGAAIKW